MKFARNVFLVAGVWGFLVLTPLYFLFDAIGRQRSTTINFPQFYYGFLAITMAWQFAFLVIASNPVRFRPLMLPSMAEKFFFVVTLCVLYFQARITSVDLLSGAPDFALGVLFVVAFARTRTAESRA